MHIGVIGLNHETAPANLREAVAMSDAKKIESMVQLLDRGIAEVVILGTCGRFEIYYCSPVNLSGVSLDILKSFFIESANNEMIVDYLYIKEGAVAIEHMALVAVGLDSIVLGEDQIIGQMKRAYEMARSMGCTSRYLNVVFRDAIAYAKRIKTELKLSEIPQSLSYMGVKTIQELRSLKGLSVLVVGLGEMGQLALRHTQELGARIFVTNRSQSKLDEILRHYESIQVVNYATWKNELSNVDVVICATASPHRMLVKKDLEYGEKPILLLDLSMPKDIDEDVRTLDHVTLINLDDLSKLSKQNEEKRLILVSKAKEMIQSHVLKIENWMEKEPVHRTLHTLNKLIDHTHHDAMHFIDKKLELDSHERAIVDQAIQAALKRVLRKSIMSLKAIEDEDERQQALYWLNRFLL